MIGPNLVILTWMADELWGGQAQNGIKFDFQVKFDLEGQCRSSPKTIGTWTKVFCTFVLNLVILAWTSGELSCGQTRDWYTRKRTHGHTDAGNDHTRRRKLASGKNYTALMPILLRQQNILIWMIPPQISNLGQCNCDTWLDMHYWCGSVMSAETV